MSKRRHNFAITLKSLILLFVRLIARGARIGKTNTQTQRHRQNKYCNPRACAPRVNYTLFNIVLMQLEQRQYWTHCKRGREGGREGRTEGERGKRERGRRGREGEGE